MRWTAAVMLLLVSLAGCADDEAPASADDEAFEAFEDDISSGLGRIRGIVVDPTITPLEGADIRLKGTELATQSNSDGAFQFNDLEPGPYFVEVSKTGWLAVQTSTTVVADVAQPEVLRIQIVEAPGTEPNAVTYKDEGFIACSWGVPITYGYCGEELGAEDDPSLDYLLSGKPSYVQIEVLWTSSQPASANLYLIQAVCPPDEEDICPGGTPFEGDAPYRWDEGTYTSPAVMRSPPGYMDEAMTYHGLPSMDDWWVGVDVSADGPALATGATLNQEFTGYVTVFWNLEPDEDWTFHEDGDYMEYAGLR